MKTIEIKNEGGASVKYDIVNIGKKKKKSSGF